MHIILFFLERSGNSIIDIQPVAVNSIGELVTYTSFDAAHKDTLRNHGAKIDFVSEIKKDKKNRTESAN